MDKQQLIDYLNRKYEALEFWEALREVVPSEQIIAQLQKEIWEARLLLNKVN
jgi:hypothetical protein